MNLSRRSFLAGAIATSVYASLWSIDSAKAKITAGSKKEDKELLKKMVRTLYPHDRFPSGPYERTTEDVINKGNSSPENAIMLQEGIDNGITSPQVPENIRFLIHQHQIGSVTVSYCS